MRGWQLLHSQIRLESSGLVVQGQGLGGWGKARALTNQGCVLMAPRPFSKVQVVAWALHPRVIELVSPALSPPEIWGHG